MTISHRELFVDAKHKGGDGSREKKPPLSYVEPPRLKIAIEEEEEEGEEEAFVPECPYPHLGLETPMSP